MADILCPKTGKVIRQSLKCLLSSSGGESRYLSEFEEIKPLGSGGYGFVVSCNNKLDEKHYAMKKIPLNGTTLSFDKILREVHAFSSMHHQHIVRYFQAWLEPYFAVTPSMDSSLFKTWLLEDIECELDKESLLASPTLYIQMEHCPRTLKDFLDNFIGEKYDGEKAWKLFRQIVIALSHIHDKGFIHLDLSVNNIFLDGYDNVKIGDFGLAKKVDGSNTVDRTGSDGTELYMAPERRCTGENAKIDSKADIFSLGIIMVEIVDPLDPRERPSILMALKKEAEKEGQDIDFPESLKKCPKSVLCLLAKDPSKRPSADVIYNDAAFQFKPDSVPKTKSERPSADSQVHSPSHFESLESSKNPSKRPLAVKLDKDAAFQFKPDSVKAKTEWEIAPSDKNSSKRPSSKMREILHIQGVNAATKSGHVLGIGLRRARHRLHRPVPGGLRSPT